MLPTKPSGTVVGVVKVGVGGDGVDEVEIGAGEGAGLRWCRRGSGGR